MTVTVRAVDGYWNLATSTATVHVTTTDANATEPSDQALSGGSQTFSVSFPTSGFWTVTASDVTGAPALTSSTSAAIHANPGTTTKLLIVLPGETYAPGTATGKTGTANQPASGAQFTFMVYATDASWNYTEAEPTVRVTSSDGGATLPADHMLLRARTR